MPACTKQYASVPSHQGHCSLPTALNKVIKQQHMSTQGDAGDHVCLCCQLVYPNVVSQRIWHLASVHSLGAGCDNLLALLFVSCT